MNRRDLLKIASASCLATVPTTADATRRRQPGWVRGRLSGAEALVETLLAEGTDVVFGIPGAQQNELWDTFKTKNLPYLLVTHEFSAATMADGYARSTGKPGVLCIVPGPGITNAMSGLGEALLDSVPIVAIVGDVANGDQHRAFQVHDMPQAAMLQHVTKRVIAVRNVSEIPTAVRQAFQEARTCEPGPVAVVVPYNLLIQVHRFHCPPLAEPALPFDEAAFLRAVRLLQDCRLQVGIYAGVGCMNFSTSLVRVAEMLQAPVATSISGKGVIPETHPLSVGWGYGPQGTATAERVFRSVDIVLAIGVKFGEVSTGFYCLPEKRMIHVDACRGNLGRVMRPEVCVHADAGVFLSALLEQSECLRRPPNQRLIAQIRTEKQAECRTHRRIYARCGVDPVLFISTLRECTEQNALAFVDVTVSQYWATQVFTAYGPRTFFNPTNNQAMGWSIPAALGAKKVHGDRQVLTITGDGCMLMTAMEITTAAREGLAVKFFIFDDQAYHYMQRLQRAAYRRTTATQLACINYRALATGWGVAYQEILANDQIRPRICSALEHQGPVLTRVAVDYRDRPIRWLDAARGRYIEQLTIEQKARFLTRLGSRAIGVGREGSD